MINTSMSNHINPQNYGVSAPDVACFKDVHTFVSTVGFPRSGSSLVGYLLTAHRNIVIAHEPRIRDQRLYEADPKVLFDTIIQIDRNRYSRVKKFIESSEKSSLPNESEFRSRYGLENKYVVVPNQWQARCESLQVIGVKDSSYSTAKLSKINTLKTFRENLSKKSVNCLKFIFTVRNPYDMITTSAAYWANNKRIRTVTQNDIDMMLDRKVKTRFPTLCENIKNLFTSIRAEDIFINRHEDMVASPVDRLAKLCDFLRVPAFPDYLNDCASVVYKKANKSRHELDWSEQQKEEVAKLIDQYDFFSGYSWDS